MPETKQTKKSENLLKNINFEVLFTSLFKKIKFHDQN